MIKKCAQKEEFEFRGLKIIKKKKDYKKQNKDDRFLMVENDRFDYMYSVGGRIKFGETD